MLFDNDDADDDGRCPAEHCTRHGHYNGFFSPARKQF